MRTAITIATKRGGGSVVVAGTEVAIGKQLADFKAAASAGVHPDFSSVELWYNDAGRTKFVRLREPVQTPAPEEPVAPVNDQEPAGGDEQPSEEPPAADQPPSEESPADAPAESSPRRTRRSR